MATIIHEHPHEARRRLAELGVSVEALIRAVQAGYTARVSCTDNDPPFIPGTEAWRFVVRTLREELLRLDWRKADPANFSLVINDKRQINIVVESGDALTKTHGFPKTKSLKGLYTEAAILRNNIDSDLFPETIPDDVRRVAAALEYPTWILLIHITDEECRAELSLPDEWDEGHIINWSERIFIPDETDGTGGARQPETDEGPDFDVPVRRKA